MKRIALLFTVLFLAVLAVTGPGRFSMDPLTRLERHARAVPALHMVYMEPQDDDFFYQTKQLEAVVQEVLGVEVNYISLENTGLAGFTAFGPKAPRAVNIDEKMHWTARLEVLAHEAGHRLAPPPIQIPGSESEVFAEAVSFLVCRAFGHDNLNTSATYLSIYKDGLHVLHDNRMEIEYAVTVLTGGM